VVTCAGCGKRYKAVPGKTRYKCAGCENILTFPRMPRFPASGRRLCSNCWGATDSHQNPVLCKICGQRIANGARAVFPGLFNTGDDPLPFDENDEKLANTARNLQVRIAAAQSGVTPAVEPAQGEPEPAGTPAGLPPPDQQVQAPESVEDPLGAYEAALAQIAALQTDNAALQKQLDRLRESALRPRDQLVRQTGTHARGKNADAERLRTLVWQLRTDADGRLDALELALRELCGRLATVRKEIGERLAEAIGADPRESPAEAEVVTVPANATDGPFAALLAAGIKPGASVVVSRHRPNSARSSVPAA
jgi:hypothetical protein